MPRKPARQLILDTCAFLWLANGSDRLSPSARTEIDTAQIVHVSAISAWEISFKANRDEIELPMRPLHWFNAVLAAHSLELAALSVEVLTYANELPWHHRDPADRFIIATAVLHGLDVVTSDRRFAPYEVTTLV